MRLFFLPISLIEGKKDLKQVNRKDWLSWLVLIESLLSSCFPRKTPSKEELIIIVHYCNNKNNDDDDGDDDDDDSMMMIACPRITLVTGTPRFCHVTGAPNENIVRNHLNIAFLNVF